MFKACTFNCLAAVLAIVLNGCGKKEGPPPPAPSAQETQTQAVPPANAPQQTAAPQQQQPAPTTYDAALTARSIDYLRGQIVQKDWSQARAALKQVESRPLSPEQRQYVDKLKAQIPPGR